MGIIGDDFLSNASELDAITGFNLAKSGRSYLKTLRSLALAKNAKTYNKEQFVSLVVYIVKDLTETTKPNLSEKTIQDALSLIYDLKSRENLRGWPCPRKRLNKLKSSQLFLSQHLSKSKRQATG